MKIAIVGIGVAGAYLLARLKGQHEVVGYERSTVENHDSICAWGTSKAPMEEFAKKVDLDFNDYVIHDGKQMYVDMGLERFQIKLKGLCTYNKIGLVDEKKILSELDSLVQTEFGITSQVFSESDQDKYDPKNKSRTSRPYKPAILIE